MSSRGLEFGHPLLQPPRLHIASGTFFPGNVRKSHTSLQVNLRQMFRKFPRASGNLHPTLDSDVQPTLQSLLSSRFSLYRYRLLDLVGTVEADRRSSIAFRGSAHSGAHTAFQKTHPPTRTHIDVHTRTRTQHRRTHTHTRTCSQLTQKSLYTNVLVLTNSPQIAASALLRSQRHSLGCPT